jgi:hypothetical protein
LDEIVKIPGLFFASLLFSNSCAGPSEPVVVPLGRAFELAPGQEALVDGLSVGFQRVGQDSRCPIDVVCIWEGDAAVALLLRAGSDPAAERELHTSGTLGGPETSYAGYKVRLESLLPATRSSQPIRPYDYRATLVVER